MEYKKIEDITSVVTGGTPSTSNAEYWENGEIPWLQSGCCQNCDVDSAEKYITQKGYDNSSTKLMPPDTVMIALTGATAGKIGYLTFEACGNQSITGILPNKLLNQRYLFYYLLSQRAKILSDCIGGAQPHISQGYVKNMVIPIISLEEQGEIVDVLSRLMSIITKRQNEIQKLDDLIKARFVELFGDLASPKCKWQYEKLVDMCVNVDDIKCGPFGTQLSKDEYVESGVAVWEIPQINSLFSTTPTHYLTEEKAKQLAAYSIKSGDIAMSRKGNVGKCAVFPSSLAEGIIHSDVLRIRLDNSRVLPVFMMHQLHYSGAVQHQIELVSSGAIMAGINVTKLKQIFVHIPPMEIQKQFATFVAQVDKSKVVLENIIKKYHKIDLITCMQAGL